MEPKDSLQLLKGIGEKTARRFSNLGIDSIEDLLHNYPRDYIAYDPPVSIDSLGEREGFVTVYGQIQSRPLVRYGGRLKTTVANIKDETGILQLLWFNMPFLANTLHTGSRYLFRGRLQVKGSRYNLIQPEIYTPAAYEKKMHSLQPLYALTKGVTNNLITKTASQAFLSLSGIEDPLPEKIRDRYGLEDYETALRAIHFPPDMETLRSARRRLVFDEFFYFMLALEGHRRELSKTENSYPLKPDGAVEKVIASLPYQLTKDQLKAWQDMKRDFAGSGVMHRMLQGDVGCGKTILAVLGCFTAAACGFQSVMMAPTEVLAKQHYDTVLDLVKKNRLPYRVGLLTGSLTAGEKRRMHDQIALGLIDIIIGTHALIQESVEYHDLAFAVTDEQHRFGVKQREALSKKGAWPHVLVMSATPIPRTLALLLYGDLDISMIRQMPAHRIPIKNCVIDTEKRQAAYRFIYQEIQKGRQAYVICPMVEESELLDGENVTDYAEKLAEWFPKNIRIGTLHGRMKPAYKNQVMESFLAGELDILVSTTVIEVGINVPNATVMMIENADRFGLSQLHQLRGRVGRGANASYCIFVSGSRKPETRERLDILNHSNDGFEIAEKDLALRGPGDLFGIRQSGALEFRLGDVVQDASVLYEAKEAVLDLLAEDPNLASLEHQRLKKLVGDLGENWNL